MLGVGETKAKLKLARMFVLAILAGMFIGIAGIGATTASSTIRNAAVAKLVGACIFPAGLSMVVVAGSELFTGNCLMVMALMNGRIRVSAMLRNWVVVYIGNLVGSLLVALLVTYGHTLSLFGNQLAASVVSTAQTKVTMPFADAFIRGILCNFLVCIAVWMSFAAKSVPGKIIGVFFPIMVFVLCGFEHSVANMYYISAGLFGASEYGIAAEGLTWGAFFVKNLLPVTLGNIIGGSVCVGAAYYLAYVKKDKGQA